MYWIHDSLVDDTPDTVETLPFAGKTVGIVDDSQGGIILYTHEDNAKMILDALEGAL